jgi:hypothetical protein
MNRRDLKPLLFLKNRCVWKGRFPAGIKIRKPFLKRETMGSHSKLLENVKQHLCTCAADLKLTAQYS